MKKKNKMHIVFVLLRKASRARFPRENSFSRCSCIEGDPPPPPTNQSVVTFNNSQTSAHRCTNLKQLTAKQATQKKTKEKT